MTVTEQARHRLHAHLEEIMGEEHAAALTEWLPDGPLATKADIDGLRAATKADIDGLRAATKADIDGLRAATKADIDGLRAATGADIDHLREIMDVRWEFTATKADVHDLRAEMHQGFTRQTWALVTAMGVLNGLLLGGFKLVT